MSKIPRYIVQPMKQRHCCGAAACDKEGVFTIDGEVPWTRERIDEQRAVTDGLVLLAADSQNNGMVIGYAQWIERKAFARVLRIVVHPWYRGHSLGKSLLLSVAKATFMPELRQDVHERNYELQCLWRSLGAEAKYHETKRCTFYRFVCLKSKLSEASSISSLRHDGGRA